MYSYFNPNPAGRNVSDCTVRAICKATGKDWGEVYLSLCIQGLFHIGAVVRFERGAGGYRRGRFRGR